ncbi:glycine cleavage system aminomethyltransferase GcvT [Halobellus salinisoli]|uniref:glycine cleavage system aminomethyltransferase GcvT n=1 Tax=Halobellus salinisoli TaxID=3108500 RepID=UPI00300A951A
MSPKRPPLAAVHEAAGARTTEFGGWEMPVQFDSIRAEHAAVRESAGIFDVSHMGEVYVDGPDAAELMDRLTTNDVASLEPGGAQYACILREDGVILDDTVVYDLPAQSGYLFVPNAGHNEQMTARWREAAAEHGLDVTVTDSTDDRGMVAVQGPEAIDRVEEVAADPIADVPRFGARRSEIDGVDALVARTGYTGEDGVEIVFDAEESEAVWAAFDDVRSCGLGARDTLRLEAGLLLSGQDFHPADEPRTPVEAGLGFAVDESGEFVGSDALERLRSEGTEEKLVGIELRERGVPRHGCPVVVDGDEVGRVTSGTMSPTLDLPIALAYVDTEHAEESTPVSVEIRGEGREATITDQRFLQRRRSN